MQENLERKLEDHTQRYNLLKLFLGHARKRASIYAAASVFAIAAALGTASFRPTSAEATADTQIATSQKLPSFAPLVKKVEGAVVSIRVKANTGEETASKGEDQFENENPFKGSPFERFF